MPSAPPVAAPALAADGTEHPPGTLPAWLALLLQAAGLRAADECLVRATAATVGDWPRLVEAAEYHGLSGLAARLLAQAAPDLVPVTALERLRAAQCDAGTRGLLGLAGLARVLDVLQAAAVDALPLKGPALAATLYRDPSLRPVSDLDILVRREHVPAALNALAGDGYEVTPPLRKVSVRTLVAVNREVVVLNPRRLPVDLQWEIADRGHPFAFLPALLWQGARTRVIEGRPIPYPDAEPLLLFLCVHGTKHLWSRLMWLGDVARLAQAGVDWAALEQLAGDSGCARPLRLGLLLAHRWLGAPVPEDVLAHARADRVVPACAEEVLRRLGRFPPVEPRLDLTRFSAALAERPSQRLRAYAALLAPTEAELVRLALPRGLLALYYPFRFARLAVKYTAGRRDRG